MLSAPCEVNIGGVYLPPLFVAACLGLLTTYAVTRLCTRFRISRFFVAPPLVFLAMTIIFSGLIDTFFFAG
jgi:hypothetical protein